MKTKLIALVAVIAWCGFWAFGALAVTASDAAKIIPLMLVVFAGMVGGSLAMLWLQRRDDRDPLTGEV